MLANLKLPRWAIAGFALPVLFLNFWLLEILFRQLQPIPSILVVASLIAFLLNFPIGYLERHGVGRIWSVLSVLLLAVALVLILGFGVGPIVYQQLIEFGDRLPAIVEQIQKQLLALNGNPALGNLPVDVSKLATAAINQVAQGLEALPTQIVNVLLGIFDSALNLVITIVLTILLIFNGQKLWDDTFKRLPQPWSRKLPALIQESFRGYFAGQATLSMIQGGVLMVLFLVCQIPFGLLFGIVIGIASFIPFGGSVSIALILPILAAQNIWLAVKLLLIALVVGQINENIIAPRLIGEMTGVNPAVVFIALLCGAKLAGVLGILLAVPITSFLRRLLELFFNTAEPEIV